MGARAVETPPLKMKRFTLPPPRRLQDTVFALVAAAFIAALASACSEPSAPSVISHSAGVDADNGQIVFVSVALSAPARVAVEYENEYAGKFRTALSEAASEHAVPVVRLRADAVYRYAVGVEQPDGSFDYGARGEFATGALPGILATMRSETRGESSQDLIMADYKANLHSENPAGNLVEQSIVMRDALGHVVWHYDAGSPFKYALGAVHIQPGGNIMYQLWDCCIIEITPLGERVNEIAIPADDESPHEYRTHHDFMPLADGRILHIGGYSFVFDDSANGGLSETTAQVDAVIALDPATGETERVWDPMDFWDARDPNQRTAGGIMTLHWPHMNSLSKSPGGGYVASLRNLNQVVSLSPDFKTVRWRLGGPGGDFDFPDPTDRFTRQHTASEFPNGNILVFDNRADCPEEEDCLKYSRALELRLDFDAMTAVKAWEFNPEPRMYSRFLSSAYRLDNGNTLVNFGHSQDFANLPIAIVEVDAQGREVFRLESIDPPLAEASIRGPERYRAYPGPKSIMGETMLRAPKRRAP